MSIALKAIDFGNDPLTADRLLAVVAELMHGSKEVKEEQDSDQEEDVTGWQPKPTWQILPVCNLSFNHDSIAHAFRDERRFEDLVALLQRRGPGWPLTQCHAHISVG